jgi:hypothetical protein
LRAAVPLNLFSPEQPAKVQEDVGAAIDEADHPSLTAAA